MRNYQKDTFTIRDVAKLCGISEEAVRQWCRNGSLKSHYDGYRYTIKRSDLLQHFLHNDRHADFLRESTPIRLTQSALKLDILEDLKRMQKGGNTYGVQK